MALEDAQGRDWEGENKKLRALVDWHENSLRSVEQERDRLRAENELLRDADHSRNELDRLRAENAELIEANNQCGRQGDIIHDLRARIVELEETLRKIQEWTDDNSIARMAAEVLNSASDAALAKGNGK